MTGDFEETFVLIVGGGPVGLTSAIDLAQRGVPCILITENLETATQPRCNFVNARTMEHFRRLGLAEEVRAAAPLAKMHPRVAFVTRFCGHEFGNIDLLKTRLSEGQLGPESGLSISQLFLEPLLRRHAEASESVDVRFGTRLVALGGEDGAPIATVEDVRTGVRKRIRSRYVIGADGARSPVRRHFNISMAGDDGRIDNAFVSGTMITYFVRAPTLLEESRRAPATITWIINHDLRAFVFAQDGRERWIIHYQVPEGLGWEQVRSDEVMRSIFGKDLPYEILAEGPWTGGLSLVAAAYRAGPAFLVGDAAHLYTPLGGFGMNTGIGDVLNLTWKLAAAYSGWAGPNLLDSYEAERRSIGLRNSKIGIHCSKRKGKWLIPPTIEDEGEAGARARKTFGDFVVVDDLDEYDTSGLQLGERYESSPIVCANGTAAPPDTWSNYKPADFPGARSPHFWPSPGRGFYDLLGRDYTLVDFESGEPLEALLEAAKLRRLPLSVVRCPAPGQPYQSKLVLVRPDQHIAWHGNAPPEDPTAVIDRVRGA
ncbi:MULTISPECIES: FAD-dependent monooxygenase [Bradyrhizobium]|uniref:FAD-binding domain-containing protein n=3 Tax=Bradyrhizobium TaxID=374 RepID=A0A410VJ21_9BRAD|nr:MULTISPECIES: FAD-dependent monooxygenase [Bradyrhizobium]MCG2629376.1 FAD-dependent monooxygenase [Bradyrhizobium zhengyangense]MCG2644657.1 FAD-dependent monooxygenase [Bradyrhizobium zhengyangense]MCG2670890.1 FAD-dependent monooxygenase [Bradyrhizobium zhengyangense]MDN4984523.1 FAD-dependent monooxygenase [Bradyrhizobium sp. WYCCWR 13022]MDN5002515.1 FAD-dependent monooxygenase [Bradyrhizobium sp. WYCCWR 12677]